MADQPLQSVGAREGRPVPCARCGYDLQRLSLEAGGECSECGAPRELTAWFWSEETLRWRKSVAWGARLIAVALPWWALQVVMTVLVLLNRSWAGGPRSAPGWMTFSSTFVVDLFNVPMHIASGVGVVLITMCEPGGKLSTQRSVLVRRLARWVVLTALACALMLPKVNGCVRQYLRVTGGSSSDVPAALFFQVLPVLLWITIWLFVLGTIVLFVHAFVMVRAAGSTRLRMHFQIVSLGSVILLGLSLLLLVCVFIVWRNDNGMSIREMLEEVDLSYLIVGLGGAIVLVLLWAALAMWETARWYGHGLKKKGKE